VSWAAHEGTGKVRAGFFSFTEITDPSAHPAYNAWHQLDHLPEQRPLPGLAGGQRWVATPACRAARPVEDEALAPTHYVTLYLFEAPVAPVLGAFFELARDLHSAGRFFPHRRTLLTGPLAAEVAEAAPRVQVSGAAVPFRPHAGVVVVAGRPGATGPLIPAELPDEVAGRWSFAGLPAGVTSSPRWTMEDRHLEVLFCDGDPLAAADALAPALAEAADVAWASPLLTIEPGRWDWFEES
jgi:hypothetical protein